RADEQLSEAQPHGMGTGSLNAGPSDPGIDVRLADACQPLIRRNLHHNVVLGRARCPDVIVRIQQDMAVNLSDLHGFGFCSLSAVYSWDACSIHSAMAVLNARFAVSGSPAAIASSSR